MLQCVDRNSRAHLRGPGIRGISIRRMAIVEAWSKVRGVLIAELMRGPEFTPAEVVALPRLGDLDPFRDEARPDPAFPVVGFDHREREGSVIFNSGI